MSTADRYAVFGNPIKHSKSPLIHSEFAAQCGQSMLYRAVRVDVDQFEERVLAFFAEGGSGLNITVPFKERACQMADRLGERARRAGAANTLHRDADGALVANNTDGIGLVADMVANLGWSLQGNSIVVLGAGGAARGILAPLLAEAPSEILVVNRTASRAAELASEFADLGTVTGGEFGLLEGRDFDVVINATSAGLSGAMPDLPAGLLNDRSCCYDLVYGAEPTAFMRWAAQHTAWAVSDGLGMLVEQAAQSFHLWRGQRPETGPVISRVRAALLQQAA